MTDAKDKSLDKLALILGLGGVLLAVIIAILGMILDRNLTMTAYGVFVTFQIAAIVLGILTRAKPLGKTAAITSSVLLAGSLLFLS
jgi:hypothetical protein